MECTCSEDWNGPSLGHERGCPWGDVAEADERAFERREALQRVREDLRAAHAAGPGADTAVGHTLAALDKLVDLLDR